MSKTDTYKYQIETSRSGSETISVYTIYANGFELAEYVTKQGVLIQESGNSSNRYALKAFEALRKLDI